MSAVQVEVRIVDWNLNITDPFTRDCDTWEEEEFLLIGDKVQRFNIWQFQVSLHVPEEKMSEFIHYDASMYDL